MHAKTQNAQSENVPYWLHNCSSHSE